MDYSSLMSDPEAAAGFGALAGIAVGLLIFILIIALIVSILQIIGQWHMNKKAGEAGWAAIVPVYNLFVLIKIAKLEWWHFLVFIGLTIAMYIPVDILALVGSVGVIVYYCIINVKLAKAFGKSAGFGVLNIFFPFIGYMILGCGSATYEG